MKRPSDRFPGSLKALRAKFPKGAIIQARIETCPGDTVEFRGAVGPEGSPLDKVIAAVRLHCQEPGGAPSGPTHEGKSSPGSARVDSKRGEVRREPVRGKSRASNGGGDEKRHTVHTVLYQAWEESERGWGVRPDGYSLHVDRAHRDKFVDALLKRQSEYFKGRGLKDGDVPDEYTRTSGEPVPVSVTAIVFRQLVAKGGNHQGLNSDGVHVDKARNLVTANGVLPK